MELTIEKQQFLRGLARTHGVADRKSSMHILSNVLLTAEGPDRLRLSATDLYLGVTALVPATVLGAWGLAALRARRQLVVVFGAAWAVATTVAFASSFVQTGTFWAGRGRDPT